MTPLILASFVCSGRASSAESDRPHIVVHKDIQTLSSPSHGYLVKGQTFKVIYTVSYITRTFSLTSADYIIVRYVTRKRLRANTRFRLIHFAGTAAYQKQSRRVHETRAIRIDGYLLFCW